MFDDPFEGYLIVSPQILTAASLTYKQQKRFCEVFIFDIFFLSDSCPFMITPYFIILFRK